MTDIMFDLETTHTDPEAGGILQLAAIKFNLATGSVGEHFDRCPALLPRRHWSEGTQGFWREHMAVYQSIVARQEDGPRVFQDFSDWVAKDAPQGGYRLWAKPIKFDWPFLESHFIQLGLPFPFPHRNSRDMNSFISGMRGTGDHIDLSKEVPFNGNPHNALHDCAYQIDTLLYAKSRHVMAEVL